MVSPSHILRRSFSIDFRVYHPSFETFRTLVLIGKFFLVVNCTTLELLLLLEYDVCELGEFFFVGNSRRF